MPASLTTIPLELRHQIYEYVYASQVHIKLSLYDTQAQKWRVKLGWDGREERRFRPVAPARSYPPRGSDVPSSKTPIYVRDKTHIPLTTFNVEEFMAQHPPLEESCLDGFGYDNDDCGNIQSIVYREESKLVNGKPVYRHGYVEDVCDDDFEKTALIGNYKILGNISVDTALLMVSRQLHDEVAPFFYRSIIFIFDCSSLSAMRFLLALPSPSLDNIMSIGFTSKALCQTDPDSEPAWRSPCQRFDNGGTLFTPLALFLSARFPRLTDLYLGTPVSGDADWFCGWAPIELHQMLGLKAFRRLHHVFCGRKAAKLLRRYDSEKAFQRFMEDLLGVVPQNWQWTSRNLDFGSDGNVQAVITFTNDC